MTSPALAVEPAPARARVAADGRPATGERALPLLAALLVAASLAPTMFVSVPAMVDYLNHAARMDILSRVGTPDANPFYAVEWRLYPNLAMDLIVPPLAKLIGPLAAMRVFLLLSQLLLVTGAAAIERVVSGSVRLSPFAACLFLYSTPFTFGFLNFEFGLGAALWGIAAMIACDQRPALVRLAIHAVFCVLLFVAHLYAFGVYGAALGLHELSRLRSLRADFTRVARRFALLAAPAFALFAFLFLTGGTVGGESVAWFFAMKPLAFLHILNGYDFAVSASALAVVLASLAFLAAKGFLRFSRAGVFIALGFAALYLATPSRIFGVSYADFRILPAAALILPAFMTLRLPNTRWRIAAAGVVAAAALANIVVVFSVWTSYAPEYRAMIASFAMLDKEARVLVGHSGEGRDPPADLTEYPLYHAPVLAVHYADAFVPTVFTETGKQPIRPQSFISALDVGCEGPAPARLLKAIAEGGAENAPGFLRNWARDYDYLYVVGPLWTNPMPERLTELARGERFILYRILNGRAEQRAQR